jgi:hypothetical protein
MDQAVSEQEGPIVCAQSPAPHSTIAGCSGPTAGSSPVALAAGHPLARAGPREVVPGRRDVVAVAVAGIPGPGVDTVGSEEGSPGPAANIVVAEEHGHQLALLVLCPFAYLVSYEPKDLVCTRHNYLRASSRASCRHRAAPSSSS